MNAIVPPVILVLGLVLLGAGIFTFLQQRLRIARAARTEGVVTDLIAVRKGETLIVSKTEAGVALGPGFRYRPKVRFRTQDGRTLNLVARVSSRPSRFKVGERVGVFYDPHDPAQAQIDSFLDLWFLTLMLVFWGLFAIGMGGLGTMMTGLFDPSPGTGASFR
jgi:hypothetical protein